MMKTKILFAVLLVALMMSCSTEFSDNDFLVEPPESFDALMAQGWSAFETENYGAAVETFAAAAERKATLPEVYLGLGWSNIRDLNLENGRIYLGSAISFAFLDAVNGPQIILDCKSGLAGIALAEGNYDMAIDYVDAVLMDAPAYEFSHDSSVNLQALQRIRMTAAFYRGDYTQAFEELLEMGVPMDNVVQETPATSGITALSTVAAGFIPATGDTLATPWLKITAPAHGLEVGDSYVIAGLSDNGDAVLTPLVDKITQANGYKVKYLLPGDEILVAALDSLEATQIGSVTLASAKYMEATGTAALQDGSALDGIVGISVYSGRQLVYINSVAAMADDGANYTVTSIDEGGTAFSIFGNPVFSDGQRVSVDYYHTEDFGMFLTELVDLISNLE